MHDDELWTRVDRTVASWRDRLVELSHDLHAHPELNFAEHHAHDRLCALLADAGFAVERHAGGLETAFVAHLGDGSGPRVAVLCEYDALPVIGHACGHNVIAAIGAGAGIAAAEVVEELDGRLTVIGTPAEEGGGGKIDLLEAGVFDEVDLAVMVHPADSDLTAMDAIAVAQFRVDYTGQAAHAAAAPHQGRNALDAAVLGYLNVAALRQHIDSDERVHGIFTRAGDAPNVVPSQTQALWFVRSPTLDSLDQLAERVHACLRAGALAAGCDIAISEANHTFADMIDNPILSDLYVELAGRVGREVNVPDTSRRVVGSTDMGNVSHRVPSIHPMIRVAPTGVAIHTQGFATAAISADADLAIVDGARILGALAGRCWADPSIVEAARSAFATAIRSPRAAHL